MRLDSLRNLAVIDPDTASRLGTVTDYWLDPAAGRVAALQLRPVDIDQTQRVAATRVACVGHDAVMLASSAATNAAALESPATWLDQRRLKSLTVYTDTGDELGRINGAHVDPRTLEIQSYELATPFWRAWLPGRRLVTGERVAWCGRDVLVVRTEQPAKLRPVGHEDGKYAAAPDDAKLSHAKTGSHNGVAV